MDCCGTATVWAAVSRGSQNAARNDRELFVPGNPPFRQVGGSNFVSEQLIATELGYRIDPTLVLPSRWRPFYDDYNDIRSVEQVNPPAGSPTTVGNGQQGESYGAELTVDYRVTMVALRAGYTEIQIQLRAKPGSTDTSNGGNESHDPNHQFSFALVAGFTLALCLYADFRYVSRITNQSVPEYCELDARLAWQPTPKLEISIVVRTSCTITIRNLALRGRARK